MVILSPSCSLSLALIHSSISHLQFSRQIFVLLQTVALHSLVQAGSSQRLMAALWTVRGTDTHRGCRMVAEFKSRAGICASKLLKCITLCMFGFYWMTLWISHLLRFLCEPQTEARVGDVEKSRKIQFWISKSDKVKLQDLRRIVGLCRQPLNIKRLRTYLHTITSTPLCGLGRVWAVGQLWHGKGYPPICPLS